MGKGPFKMKGHELPGPNQRQSPNKFWGAIIGKAVEKKDEMVDNIGTMLNPPKPYGEPKNEITFSEEKEEDE